jgi:transcriptional regulator with XRE-family HTH domain
MNYINNRIRALMVLNNISTDDLLKKASINKFQLDNILHGKSRKIDLIISIAKALGVSLDILCDPPKNLTNKDDDVIFFSSEIPLCIDILCKKYELVLPKSCSESLLKLIKENSKDVSETNALIHQAQGILLLLKKYPKLIGLLS